MEIREKDAVKILNYIKDNPDCYLEDIEDGTGISIKRQQEIGSELEKGDMIEFSIGWNITKNCLEIFNKEKKWMKTESSDYTKKIGEMIKKGQIYSHDGKRVSNG